MTNRNALKPQAQNEKSHSPVKLEDELWRRRQDRRDAVMMDGEPDQARLLPLILALARLSAQRDAAMMRTLATD